MNMGKVLARDKCQYCFFLVFIITMVRFYRVTKKPDPESLIIVGIYYKNSQCVYVNKS